MKRTFDMNCPHCHAACEYETKKERIEDYPVVEVLRCSSCRRLVAVELSVSVSAKCHKVTEAQRA